MPTQKVKSRRPHTKSRSGCTQCRGRRVKCDETRPICSNCQDRGKDCIYSRPMRGPGLHNFAVKDSALSAPYAIATTVARKVSHPLRPITWTPIILLQPREGEELRFLHFWSTQTCYSFTPVHAPFLRDRVRKQALSCDFLMGALLASTSLQLASDAKDTATARRLVNSSLDHQNRAIAGLQQNLKTLSPKNCDDVFLTTVLMMMCAFVSSTLPVAHAKSSTGMMIDAFHCLKGTQAVGLRCFPWLFQGRAMELFGTSESKATETVRFDAATTIESLRCMNHIKSSGDNREILESLISKLEKGFSGDIDQVPWLMSAGANYIDLLCQNNLVAKALLMHYGVLLARTEGIWWARLAGEKIVNDMAQVLKGSWDGSVKMVEWCRSNMRR